jgi:aryl-alcohol dehydrogenase-like predicted oxidoreductase
MSQADRGHVHHRLLDCGLSQQGLGCMGMSWSVGTTVGKQEAITLIRRAVELGVSLWPSRSSPRDLC